MHKQILKLSIPNIISNITVPLLGMVDLALMGHLGHEKFIGAIALSTVIFNFIYWGFSFLRMGTSGFTAQAFGEGNDTKSSLVLIRALIVACIGAVIIILLQTPIKYFSFELMKGSENVELLAKSYFDIRIWAAPATISIYALSGWFLGMQNAKVPMIASIFSNIVNIAFSYYFVYHTDLNVQGVALGTVIAQYCSAGLLIVYLVKMYPKLLHQVSKKNIFQISEFKMFFSVNRDIFIRTLCVILVFTFFTSKSAATNNTILAVNALLLQFLFIFSYFIDGFAFAAEALVGKFIGKNDKLNFHKIIRLLFIWGGGMAFIFSILYFVFGDFILSLLTSQSHIIEASQIFKKWVILLPVASAASFIWDGIYIGATASKGMRNSMIGATFLLFFPCYFILEPSLGNHALWIAMIGFLAARGIFQTIIAKQMFHGAFKTN